MKNRREKLEKIFFPKPIKNLRLTKYVGKRMSVNNELRGMGKLKNIDYKFIIYLFI